MFLFWLQKYGWPWSGSKLYDTDGIAGRIFDEVYFEKKNQHPAKAKISQHTKSWAACQDPESFVRGGPTGFFYSLF